MTASSATREFIDQLRFRGVELWVEGDRLRYNAPKGVINDDVLDELKRRKAEIISALQVPQKGTADLVIRREERTDHLPLSFAQQRIWFLDELEPENPFYNVALAKHIQGKIDCVILRRSLHALIERHEVLRSTCEATDTGPRLRVVPANAIDLNGEWFQIQNVALDCSDAELEEHVNAEVRPALPLSHTPLLRTRLFQRGDTDAVLTFTTHHFVVDGWSCGVLMRELTELYVAFSENRTPVLPEITIQYADFAAWQNRWLTGPQPDAQLQYWGEKLAGLSTLNLPTDKPRPALQSYRGDIYHFELPDDLGKQLKEFCRSEGLTLYMALLAGFQILLHRYSQQDEVVLGTAVSNRHSAQLEALLGPFVNTLVLRGDLGGNPSFRALVRKARDLAADAFAHQDLPFELLVERLKPERDRSRSPLFQVLFVVHQYSGAEELALQGTDTRDYPVAPGTTMYDLFLQLIELNGKLSGSIEFSTDLFERSTIVRMVNHLTTLLSDAAKNPDTLILDLPLMTGSEAQLLTEDWNATDRRYPADLRLEQLFEQAARLTPDAIAVVHGSTKISYSDLNRRANQLAHYLRSAGLEKGKLAGIYLDRSIDMMIALLGILKAGATYVPLDPLFPPERIHFMMEDAELSALISQSTLINDLSSRPDKVVIIDELRDVLETQNTDTPDAPGNPEDRAYVIYTSGSTGLPKGVQLAHRGVVNFLCTMADKPGLQQNDILVAVTTLSFDIAVLELFLPLTTGARLVIADRDVAADGSRLAELIAESNATIMQATPATWQLLLNADWEGKPGMKVLCGGEALPRELANRLLATGIELWNMYGPTETTIWSSVSQVQATGPITIGKPIANTQMYIVDAQMRTVPIGVPGELCIAGDGVALGYLKRPELTADRFIPNPLRPAGSLLYRTGDLARYRENGEIECLGRNDTQVKIRGYRMELGEIETVLAQHPAVKQAVVAAREDREGDKRLVGYLIADQERLASTELEQWKNDQLDQWRDLWQNAYSGDRSLDPSFNISGWKSSYSGDPIPAAEMREWIEATAERVNAIEAERVLEVGGGTGLVAARVGPTCRRYLATDFSPASIEAINNLKQSRKDLAHLEAWQLPADRLKEIAGERFDVVIINSVAQYFPDQPYLIEVIKTAASLLTDGGKIFLGDLRSLALLEAYHTSVQLSQADDGMELTRLAERIRQRVDLEEELLIDPAMFQQLTDELPALTRVEFQLKRGTVRNEMSCFRYDAILTVGNSENTRIQPERIDWQPQLSAENIEARLQNMNSDGLLITGIVDARLQSEILAMRRLHEVTRKPDDTVVNELRLAISTSKSHGLQPETLYQLAASRELHLQMINTAPGLYNALFLPADAKVDGRLMLPARDLTLRLCCNNPMQGRIQRNLIPALRDHLRLSLPEYMVPAVFTLLDEFPLTPNGKIDRKALPAPDQPASQSYTPPRNETEEQLVAIWEQLLGVDQVGVLDDFFGLGGHSLLATQLISRIRDQLHISLPLNSLFDTPTVAGLATAIETLSWAMGNNEQEDSADTDTVEIEI